MNNRRITLGSSPASGAPASAVAASNPVPSWTFGLRRMDQSRCAALT
jgi:hypothetical protein